jgi:hypothetical protein
MTQTITCQFGHGTIGPHWQLQMHATCTPPILERAVRALSATPGQQDGGASLTWCRDCHTYHLKPHSPIGRHVKRAVTTMLRQW